MLSGVRESAGECGRGRACQGPVASAWGARTRAARRAPRDGAPRLRLLVLSGHAGAPRRRWLPSACTLTHSPRRCRRRLPDARRTAACAQEPSLVAASVYAARVVGAPWAQRSSTPVTLHGWSVRAHAARRGGDARTRVGALSAVLCVCSLKPVGAARRAHLAWPVCHGPCCGSCAPGAAVPRRAPRPSPFHAPMSRGPYACGMVPLRLGWRRLSRAPRLTRAPRPPAHAPRAGASGAPAARARAVGRRPRQRRGADAARRLGAPPAGQAAAAAAAAARCCGDHHCGRGLAAGGGGADGAGCGGRGGGDGGGGGAAPRLGVRRRWRQGDAARVPPHERGARARGCRTALRVPTCVRC